MEKTTNQNYGEGGGKDEDQKLQTQTNSKQIVSKFPIKKQKRRSKQEKHRKRQYFQLKHWIAPCFAAPQPSPLKTSILSTLQLDVPPTQLPLQFSPFHSRNQNKLRQRSYQKRIQTLSKHTQSKKAETSRAHQRAGLLARAEIFKICSKPHAAVPQ